MRPIEIVQTPNAKRVAHLKPAKIPSLKRGDDAKIAAELNSYIIEAEKAVLAILRCGFFIELIADQLPHGQLGPWVAAHIPNRSWRSVQQWKATAAALGDALGVSLKQRISLELHKHIFTPLAELPANIRPIREKLEQMVEGKTYRQLVFDLRQSDESGSPKRGNLSGKGCTKADREAAALAEEEARITELHLSAEDTAKWLIENADHKRIGILDDKHFSALLNAIETAHGYMREVLAARIAAKKGQS